MTYAPVGGSGGTRQAEELLGRQGAHRVHGAPVEQAQAEDAPQRIGMAVVGAGYWGPNLVRNAQQTAALRLHWLCDLDEERAGRVLGRYSTVRTTTSFDEVLADTRVQAVAIATPAATHYRLVRAALEAGKHVLVEKPITTTADEAAELVELAERRGLVLMCDHTFCYTPVVRRIRELVHGGELGDLQFFDSVRINLGLVQPDVDVLWDLAPHDLSILDFVLPPGVVPVGVSAQAADPIGAGRACVAYLAVRLSNGALAHRHVNWLSPTKVRTTLIGGSRRTLVWDDLNPQARLAIHDRGVDLTPPEEVTDAIRRRTLISYRVGDMVAPALGEQEALRGVMAEFAAAVTEGRAPLTDGRSGLRVLRLLHAAARSLELGGAAVPVAVQDSTAAA
ncbi:Gfo/Idh/MocA family oxidoreductase [Kitasatospora sp. GP82]|uniref:Gfo/Idh/MocA family protein n=1 Tax=Kitasatospora sp. GP82 TaxID=3035089 RepID=UPI002476BED3|nr:Gfo/Idh/MocA family oxidoreductase [Kitasatospora sp. GP82]MDH6123082.1 putative dehydrogenase [Kitasatospora sp. GP82]